MEKQLIEMKKWKVIFENRSTKIVKARTDIGAVLKAKNLSASSVVACYQV